MLKIQHFLFAALYCSSNRKTISKDLLGHKNYHKIFKTILFLYNLIECILEMTAITHISLGYLFKGEIDSFSYLGIVLMCSCLSMISVADSDFSCEIMMAHYFHQLTIMNRHIFICISGAHETYMYTKGNTKGDNNEHVEDSQMQRIFTSILMFTYPILNWLCIRYDYRLPFNLLIQNIVLVSEPITYFCKFVRPGKVITIVLFDSSALP